MNRYSVEKMFSVFSETEYKEENISESNFLEFVDRYVEILQPDFIVMMNVQNISPILFEKNYNIQFSKNQKGSIQDILDGIKPDHLDKILETDAKIVEFGLENIIPAKKVTLHSSFSVEIIPGNVRRFVRVVIAVSKDKNNRLHLVLGSIFDVTDLYGLKENVSIDIKTFGDLDEGLLVKLQKFKFELNSTLFTPIKLTKREKQVLDLIGLGKTSQEIADALFISVTTVNTHRQNLIKKNNVSNTTALLNSM